MEARTLSRLPLDTLEDIFRHLDVKDTTALAQTCKTLRDVARTPTVWADLVVRSFALEELPCDLGFLRCRDAVVLRSQFRKLSLQRPAFLSDAQRTSEILEHTGSRFRKVLHIDGRRDLNFTTVFRAIPPGHYNVVWRLMLQPGYVRGYCNFRAVFGRPADSRSAAKAAARARDRRKASAAKTQHQQQQHQRLAAAATRLKAGSRPKGGRDGDVGDGSEVEDGALAGPGSRALPPPHAPGEGLAAAHHWRLSPCLKRWLPLCLVGQNGVAPHDPDGDPDGVAAVGGSGVAVAAVEAAVAAAEATAMAAAATAAAGAVEAGVGQPGVAWDREGPRPTPPPPSDAERSHHRAGPRAASQHRQQQQHQHQQVEGQGHPVPAPGVELPLEEHPEIEPVAPPQPQLQPGPQAQAQNGSSGPQRAPAAAPPAPAPRALAQQQQQRLQRAMGQLASVSAKRDAALAGSGGSRYVPRWLSPLWGSHACSWRQLDPAGPVGCGAWRTVHMGTVTVRRPADVHLHGVMVQLRPANAEQQQLALPPGETRWRGALVDFVELVPARHGGLLEGLVPGFLHSLSPVFPELEDVVALPRV